MCDQVLSLVPFAVCVVGRFWEETQRNGGYSVVERLRMKGGDHVFSVFVSHSVISFFSFKYYFSHFSPALTGRA